MIFSHKSILKFFQNLKPELGAAIVRRYKVIRVAINGFGRIGRSFARCWLGRKDSQLELVAINDTSDPKTNAHLLRYDSMMGTLKDVDISTDENSIILNGKTVKCVSDRNPLNLPWKDWGIDLIIEATGVFVDQAGASKHITAGAKKVLITAPGKGPEVGTYVMGVNHHNYKHSDYTVISNASCTTNCLAPVLRVLHENFGIIKGMMTTTHSYTGDQRLLDASHRDLRRARAAAMNIVPTTTGAAQAVALVIPELKGKFDGYALRVPTPTVSIVDFVVELERPGTVEEVNAAFRAAADGDMEGILGVSDEPLVSSDYIGTELSTIVDSELTMVMGENLFKVVAWYD